MGSFDSKLGEHFDRNLKRGRVSTPLDQNKNTAPRQFGRGWCSLGCQRGKTQHRNGMSAMFNLAEGEQTSTLLVCRDAGQRCQEHR